MARRHRPDELAKAMRHWKASADPAADAADDASRNTAGLAMVAGRGVLSADLDSESAAILGQVLADVVDDPWRASSEAQQLGLAHAEPVTSAGAFSADHRLPQLPPRPMSSPSIRDIRQVLATYGGIRHLHPEPTVGSGTWEPDPTKLNVLSD